MWMLDATPVTVVTQSPLTDLWHTILVAIAVWLGNKLHIWTGGNGQ